MECPMHKCKIHMFYDSEIDAELSLEPRAERVHNPREVGTATHGPSRDEWRGWRGAIRGVIEYSRWTFVTVSVDGLCRINESRGHAKIDSKTIQIEVRIRFFVTFVFTRNSLAKTTCITVDDDLKICGLFRSMRVDYLKQLWTSLLCARAVTLLVLVSAIFRPVAADIALQDMGESMLIFQFNAGIPKVPNIEIFPTSRYKFPWIRFFLHAPVSEKKTSQTINLQLKLSKRHTFFELAISSL